VSSRLIPVRVRYGLIALWIAWAITAIALAVNQLVFHGSGIGPGPAIGVFSLVVQAIAIVAIGRRSAIARGVAVLFLLVATVNLQIVGRLVAERSYVSAGYTVLGWVFKALGVYLLFTKQSKHWFRDGDLRGFQ
jgi:hypothetical protein